MSGLDDLRASRRRLAEALGALGDSPLRYAFRLPALTWDGDHNPEVRRRLAALLYEDPDLLDACTTSQRREGAIRD